LICITLVCNNRNFGYIYLEKILITGGAGFVGIHVIVVLQNAGYEVVVIDNFVNSSNKNIIKVEQITKKKIIFISGDLSSDPILEKVFSEHKIYAVIHLAGLRAVRESVEQPLKYYRNNLGITFSLLDAMQKHDVKKLIFSSSSTVYGNLNNIPFKPFTEDCPLSPISPYASAKMMIEKILTDVYNVDKTWNIAIVRYFNPIGAHESGLIGDRIDGPASSLLSHIAEVVTNRKEYVSVFGSLYSYNGCS
jgi:UDP-glucose 4-epimerase